MGPLRLFVLVTQALRLHLRSTSWLHYFFRKRRLGRGLLNLRQLDADSLIHKAIQFLNTEKRLDLHISENIRPVAHL